MEDATKSVTFQSVINTEPETEDTIIWDESGGQVLDNNESSLSQPEVPDFFKSRMVSTINMNNPLHPWKHEGEIWLTNMLFQSGKISCSTADKFLDAFANGTMIMASGPVQFTNSREIMKFLDITAEKSVVSSNTIWIYADKFLHK